MTDYSFDCHLVWRSDTCLVTSCAHNAVVPKKCTFDIMGAMWHFNVTSEHQTVNEPYGPS